MMHGSNWYKVHDTDKYLKYIFYAVDLTHNYMKFMCDEVTNMCPQLPEKYHETLGS
jgi:hypothetical protein